MHPVLRDVIPALVEELETLLRKQSHSELAEQVASLRLVERGRFRNNFCAMFYAVTPPDSSWGDDHVNVNLEPEHGMIVLDIVSGKIVAVEVLYRPEIREQLLRAVP